MKISCPHCGQHYDVEEPDLGREADCMNCGRRFVLQIPDSRRKFRKKHWLVIVAAILIFELIFVSVCRDCYLKNEAKKVHERAVKAAKEAEDAVQQYRRTEFSGKRLQELEKIFIIRGFTDSEKNEAKDLLDYMQKRAEENGYEEGRQLFIKLRRQWRLE